MSKKGKYQDEYNSPSIQCLMMLYVIRKQGLTIGKDVFIDWLSVAGNDESSRAMNKQLIKEWKLAVKQQRQLGFEQQHEYFFSNVELTAQMFFWVLLKLHGDFRILMLNALAHHTGEHLTFNDTATNDCLILWRFLTTGGFELIIEKAGFTSAVGKIIKEAEIPKICLSVNKRLA